VTKKHTGTWKSLAAPFPSSNSYWSFLKTIKRWVTLVLHHKKHITDLVRAGSATHSKRKVWNENILLERNLSRSAMTRTQPSPSKKGFIEHKCRSYRVNFHADSWDETTLTRNMNESHLNKQFSTSVTKACAITISRTPLIRRDGSRGTKSVLPTQRPIDQNGQSISAYLRRCHFQEMSTDVINPCESSGFSKIAWTTLVSHG